MLSAAILNLFRAGKDVTLLARGAWAEEIQKNGLRIKDKFSPRMSVTRIPVVTELKPEARVRIQMAFIIHKSPHLWWELLCMAESEGFEPPWRCRLTVFKTAPL